MNTDTLGKQLVFALIRLVNRIVKRRKGIVLCSGWQGKRFADNSRYLFLYLNEHRDRLGLEKIIWITRSPEIKRVLREAGYTAYALYSAPSLYYHLKAGSFFYDQFFSDFLRPLAGDAIRVNLWHGMPIKKFGCLIEGIDWKLQKGYLLTCSPLGDETIGRAFAISPAQALHGMYPRNHYLLHPMPFLMPAEQRLLSRIQDEKRKNKRILFYLPTFRKTDPVFLGEKDPARLQAFFHFLESRNYFLLTKLHFKDLTDHAAAPGHPQAEVLLNLPPQTDIYPFLKETDVLITDYSSVLFDFLYLQKEIIGYVYDLDYYQHQDQGLVIDYDTLPLDKATDLDELEALLAAKTTTTDRHAAARHTWLERCFGKYTLPDTLRPFFPHA